MAVRNQSINLPGLVTGTPYAENSGTEEILLQGWNGIGSTNTGVATFNSLPTSTTTYVVSQDSEDGASVRIDRSGLYWAYWSGQDGEDSAKDVGISVDGSILTASFALSDSGMRTFHSALGDFEAGNASVSWFITGLIAISSAQAASDSLGIVRAMVDGADSPGGHFKIVRFGNFNG